ncbi:neutral zinc metallopeptidase [Candidatus Saccharibacteria bacterium]|nr:neutral zinc metallopeptidase [Candidatus Saccharibacteria bacterium]
MQPSVPRLSRTAARLLLVLAILLTGHAALPATAMAQPPVLVPVPAPLDRLGTTTPEVAGPAEAFQSGVLPGQVPPLPEAQQYMLAVMTDLDRVWTEYFLRIGLQEPGVTYHVITPGDTTAVSVCVPGGYIPADYNNAFYCDQDYDAATGYQGKLFLPLQTFVNMWGGSIFGRPSLQAGDFAAATVEAHEFGHHIQAELQAQLNLPPIQGPGGVRIKEKELIADCFAGVWAYTAYYSQYLEGTDVEEAVWGLNTIGDAVAGGTDPHGSPQERSAAFLLGYNTGKPGDCINNYWPGVRA